MKKYLVNTLLIAGITLCTYIAVVSDDMTQLVIIGTVVLGTALLSRVIK